MNYLRASLLLLLPLLGFETPPLTLPQSADRQPAVAGTFYPGDKNELRQTLQEMFARAVPPKNLSGVAAVIVPHAGYVFSGVVAASGYDQIDPDKSYHDIFVIGPSHYVGFEGASVYTTGNYRTPLGLVDVDRQVGEQLIQGSRVFSNRTDAHKLEHSVEVQLPFLQYILKKPFRIVPIVIGADNPATCSEIAAALRPWFTTDNLFVISTDFSHYPAYEDAKTVDKATAEAILSNNPTTLMSTLQRNEGKRIPNLATSMCGWPCVLTLLSLTHDHPDVSFIPVRYLNSGDSQAGDRTRVVGYWSIAVTLKQQDQATGFRLSPIEKRTLVTIARTTLEQHFNLTTARIDSSELTASLKTPCGVFVTLKKNGELRGCIGQFEPREPLWNVVQRMAIASATQDYRFPTVRADELKSIEIELSVLTPLRRIKSIDEIELGKHGIYIRKGSQAGTFLPQVATETAWTKEQFLGHCAQDKAGIGWDGWKDADLFVYEAIVFDEQQIRH